MNYIADSFAFLCTVTGALILFAVMLYVAGAAFKAICRQLHCWYFLMLAVGIKANGKNHNDRLFWQAVEEHINGNPFAAKTVSDFANRCAPFNEETTI